MMTKVTSMVEKAKDAMKGNGTSGLRKFVRKDLKDIKDRVDAVHMMVVRNVELKLISEDVAVEQMNSLYSYADNLLETWFMQVDNTIEFYNDLKDNLFADKDFSKLTDDEYKCLKLIVKERTKLQRLSAEIQSMVCYVDTMLEDFGYLDDIDMDEEDDEEMTDEELKEYAQSVEEKAYDYLPLERVYQLVSKTREVKRYSIDYENDPTLTLYNTDGSTIEIIVTSDNVAHVSNNDDYSLFELKLLAGSTDNNEVRNGVNRLLAIVNADENNKEENDNEETK